MTQPFIPVRSLQANPIPREISDIVNQILKNFPQFGSADYRGIATATANYTVVATDWTILADASATTTLQVNLPAVATNAWRVLNVKKIDPGAGAVKVVPNASEKIDGASSKSITIQYDGLMIQTDGAAWYMIPNG